MLITLIDDGMSSLYVSDVLPPAGRRGGESVSREKKVRGREKNDGNYRQRASSR